MAGAILTAGFWISAAIGMSGKVQNMKLRATGTMIVAFAFDLASIAAMIKWSFFS
jgi:hypothetical protein